MGRIDWLPIADLPDALRDGREVLLAIRMTCGTANPGPDYWTFTVAVWRDRILGARWELAHPGAYADDVDLDHDPEFWAEISPPV